MDDVSLPSEIPSELKVIDLLVKRAKELKSHDPVMAYWCCFWAVEVGVADKRTKAGTAVLMDLLDALEKMKSILADNDAVTNKIAGQAYVENFALKVFAGADDEDRAGKASPATVRKFLAAATFLEVTRSFADDGEYDPEMEAKLKYSRFKAASLSKAFKAGTVPQAGPPPTASSSEPTPSFPSPPLDKSEAEEEQDRHRETWSNAATPGAVEDDREKQLGAKKSSLAKGEEEDDVEGVLFPSTPGRVRFAGVGDDDEGIQEGLPSFPVPPVEEENGLDAPPPSAPPLSPPPTTQPLSPVTPEKPPHIQISPLPPSDLPAPPQPPSFPASPPPPPAPSPPVVRAPPLSAVTPPAPKPIVSAPASRAAAPPPPPPAPSASSWTPVKRDEPLTQAEIEKVQKHAKWAISALNYEDVETAKKELIEALKLLG